MSAEQTVRYNDWIYRVARDGGIESRFAGGSTWYGVRDVPVAILRELAALMRNDENGGSRNE